MLSIAQCCCSSGKVLSGSLPQMTALTALAVTSRLRARATPRRRGEKRANFIVSCVLGNLILLTFLGVRLLTLHRPFQKGSTDHVTP